MTRQSQSHLLVTLLLICSGMMPLLADQTPDWLVGRYRGHNRKYNSDMELSIYPGGTVKSLTRFRDGKTSRDMGTYQEGQLKMKSGTYDMIRNGEGFRLVQTTDLSNPTEFRLVDPNLVAGGHSSADRGNRDRRTQVPSWLIGHFQGVNPKYQVAVDVTILPDGSVAAIGRFPDGRRSKDSGTFRRGKITVRTGTYYVDQTHRGFRITDVKNETNVTNYHRVD